MRCLQASATLVVPRAMALIAVAKWCVRISILARARVSSALHDPSVSEPSYHALPAADGR